MTILNGLKDKGFTNVEKAADFFGDRLGFSDGRVFSHETKKGLEDGLKKSQYLLLVSLCLSATVTISKGGHHLPYVEII